MENQPGLTSEEQTPPLQPISEAPERPSFGQKRIVLFLILIVILIFGITIYYLYATQFQSKPVSTRAQTTPTSQMVSPTKQPTLVPLQYPPNLVFLSQLQEIIAKNCKQVFTTPNSFTYYISLNVLPFTINQTIIKLTHDPAYGNLPYDTPMCDGQPNADYVTLRLPDKNELFIFDQYSKELGHGGYSFFEPLSFATNISDQNNVSLTFLLQEGMGTVIGEEPIMVRAIKTITLPNGQLVYVTLDTIAIDQNDSRLLSILNKYETPSQFQSGKFEVDSAKTPQYTQDLKNAFFADMNNLAQPEKSRIADLLATLSAISAK
jgi:hypothetical protein